MQPCLEAAYVNVKIHHNLVISNAGSAGFVEEEVFENERYQPFRAWGHTWPGHFLPTDRVGHWSLASPHANASLDTSDFDAVAPSLKKVDI